MFCVRVERHTKVVVCCCCCRCYSLRGTSCWRTGGESQTAGQALSSSRISTGFFLCSTNGRASWLAGSLTNDMYVTYESTPPHPSSWRPPTPVRLRASRRCRHLAATALDNRLLQSRTHPVALFYYFSFWFYSFFFSFLGENDFTTSLGNDDAELRAR